MYILYDLKTDSYLCDQSGMFYFFMRRSDVSKWLLVNANGTPYKILKVAICE